MSLFNNDILQIMDKGGTPGVIQTFSNVICVDSDITIRNSVFEHARLFNYDLVIESENKNTHVDIPTRIDDKQYFSDNLNYVVSSFMNIHDNILINSPRRKNFKGAIDVNGEPITDVIQNELYGDTYREIHYIWNGTNYIKGSTGSTLLTEYTRLDGTIITDFEYNLTKSVNGSTISENDIEYLSPDNVFFKFNNYSDDFINNLTVEMNVSGGVWYKAFDQFFERKLINQIETPANFSKLMINNGNQQFWQEGETDGIFTSSGVVVFEVGWGETDYNFTTRVNEFIQKLPRNLNNCTVTFCFMPFGDSENISINGFIDFSDFYNGKIEIVGLSQKRSNLTSNSPNHPIFRIKNLDYILLDNLNLYYNLSSFINSNDSGVVDNNIGIVEVTNVKYCRIIESEFKHLYIPYLYDKTNGYIQSGYGSINPEILSKTCLNVDGVRINNSNVVIDTCYFLQVGTACSVYNNSKLNCQFLQLTYDKNTFNELANSTFLQNLNYHFKYLFDISGNSDVYCLSNYTTLYNYQHVWIKNESDIPTSPVAVNIESGSLFNHTHQGLEPIYSTEINSVNGSIKDNLGSEFYPFRYTNTKFNTGVRALNTLTKKNRHLYSTVDYKYSQLPIGTIIYWISITTNVNGLLNELHPWPWGFYPCCKDFYPPSYYDSINDAINIPVNGNDCYDRYYNVPLAIKMGWNSKTLTFPIPNYGWFTNVINGNNAYNCRLIKIIKYSENVVEK